MNQLISTYGWVKFQFIYYHRDRAEKSAISETILEN
jgi:hypothetical protein